LFSVLDETVQLFIQEVNKQKLNKMAAKKWTVKDVLCHVVFWHRYYAQNFSSLAAGKKPFVFTSRGGSERNQKGVNSLRHYTKVDLLELLKNAHTSLYKSIVIDKVPAMNYTDLKRYKTDEFLQVVIGHISRHTIQVRRAKKVSDKVY
jgi:hypothetical protein